MISASFNKYHRHESGFTLLELSIVLLIAGLMLGGLLAPLSTKLEQEQRAQTQAQINESREVLYGFVLKNHRLPCPDCRTSNAGNCNDIASVDATHIGDGIEDIIAGDNCAHAAGNFPWVTLGVKGNDAWGQRLAYYVTNTFADATAAGSGCTPDTLNVSFGLCTDGEVAIVTAAGVANYIARDVPAIVLSHGRNGRGTPRFHEFENVDEDAVFVYREYSGDATSGFDDMLVWISPHILRAKLLDAGILP